MRNAPRARVSIPNAAEHHAAARCFNDVFGGCPPGRRSWEAEDGDRAEGAAGPGESRWAPANVFVRESTTRLAFTA